MRSPRINLLVALVLLMPSLIWAANTTINRVPSTTGSGAATYNTDMDRFLRQEDANRQGELPLFPQGVVAQGGGGLHDTAPTMTSPPFATVAYTSAGNRLVQASSVINYAGQGCSPAATAWVIASGQTGNVVQSYLHVPGSIYYTDCVSGPTSLPPLPPDSVPLMKVSFASGQIAAVEDIAPRALAAPSSAGGDGCLASATVSIPDTGDVVIDGRFGGVPVLAANPKRCQAVITNNGSGDMRCGPVTVEVTATVGYPVKAGQTLALGLEGREAWRCVRSTSTNTAAAIAEAISP